MDKVAAGPVGAEPDTVVGAAQVRLVFGVTGDVAQILGAVCELAFVSVLASAVLLIRAAHLSFVAVGILGPGAGGRAGGHGGPGVSLVLAPVEPGSAGTYWAIPVKAGQGISQGGGGRPETEAKWLGLMVFNLNPQTLETVLTDLNEEKAFSFLRRICNKSI